MSLKFSRQRESIRGNLMNRTDHPTADMIYSDIRRIYPNISLGTVYRNLALLHEQGEIGKITTTDGILHYDGNINAHDHFICKRCGRITDLEPAGAENLKLQASRDFPGRIDECEITYYGTCADCTQNENENN